MLYVTVSCGDMPKPTEAALNNSTVFKGWGLETVFLSVETSRTLFIIIIIVVVVIFVILNIEINIYELI